jgi:hypothetical protein
MRGYRHTNEVLVPEPMPMICGDLFRVHHALLMRPNGMTDLIFWQDVPVHRGVRCESFGCFNSAERSCCPRPIDKSQTRGCQA